MREEPTMTAFRADLRAALVAYRGGTVRLLPSGGTGIDHTPGEPHDIRWDEPTGALGNGEFCVSVDGTGPPDPRRQHYGSLGLA